LVNKGSKRQVPFVRWSAIWVFLNPLGRQFCPLGAFFNGQMQPFSTFSDAFF
jgi:hypothetical protein